MGAGTEDFVKYPKTVHLFGSKMADADKMLSEMLTNKLLATAGVDFVWESKLDGTNVGISFDEGGDLKIQNRGHILTSGEHPQYNIFRNWAYTFVDRLRETLGTRYILFGEWCYAVHTVVYKSLPHYMNEFDVWDREEKKFLSTPKRREMLGSLVADGILAQVPVVWPEKVLGYGDSGKLTLAEARKLMETHGPMYGEDKPEGLYLKVEKKGEVVGRYKMVRDEFVQKIIDDDTHWKERPIVVQGLSEGVDIFSVKTETEDPPTEKPPEEPQKE